MKIRTDFVTNSSSSSFILGFTSEDTIADELRAGFSMPEEEGYFNRVLEDLRSADSFENEEAVLKYIAEEVKFWIELDLVDKKFPFYTMGTREAKDTYLQSDEYKQQYAEKLDRIIGNIKEKLASATVFKLVEYEDHTHAGDMLEHNLMPNHPCTAYVINNH